MWRFKPSKYKNATPKVPKKGEGWILDISVGSPLTYGNHVKASSAFIAFNVDARGGGSLGVLSLNDSGRKSTNLTMLHAHAEQITDFEFCPFDDGILATCSQDCLVKVWRIPKEGLNNSTPCNPEIVLPVVDHRVEVILFNPSVDCILASADSKTIRLWDVSKKEQVFSNSYHEDIIQSISWKGDGSMLVSSGKDCKLYIWDPRCDQKSQETSSFANNKDSRVLWLGNSDHILSTGFGSRREREVILRDVRNFGHPLNTHSGESSLGLYIPLFDPDTNMLFLGAKGDTTLSFWEIMEKEPYFNESSRYVGEVQTKGVALVPKRALNVMQAEVNRVLLLGSDCIVPISYQVPRKTYREFHSDLFPDTLNPEPVMTANNWTEGEFIKLMPKTLSLNPAKTPSDGLVIFNHILGSGPKITENKGKIISEDFTDSSNMDCHSTSQENKFIPVEDIAHSGTKTASPKPQISQKPAVSPKPSLRSISPRPKTLQPSPTQNGFKDIAVTNEKPCSLSPSSAKNMGKGDEEQASSSRSPSPRRPGRTFGIRVSKFRHLDGTILPKETHITNITNLSRTIPGESDGFHANVERVAIPVGNAGGHIAVIEISDTGRLPSSILPGVICGTAVMDFTWDPFDSNHLATGCDTGEIKLWHLPAGTITSSLTEPSVILRGHKEKVYFIKFHPLAKDILVSGSHDMSVIIWDLATQEEKLSLQGHSEQIFNASWSPDGCFLATVSKDQILRVYDPRSSPLPIKVGPGPQGSRGARVVWVLGGSHLVTSGFSKVSERQLSIYDINNLSSPLNTIGIDVSPAILIPYYDEDSSTLFATGKGDSTIFAFEVATDMPYFHPLSHYKCSGPHQAVSFLPKYVCNIAEVEFARAIRLTTTSIEPMSFTVPRLRSEFFQDDLFPNTRVLWKPSLKSFQWFSGENIQPQLVSLQPEGMIPLSEAPPPTRTPVTSQSPSEKPKDESLILFSGELVLESSLAFLQGGKEKEEMIVQAMKDRCQLYEDASLPQDSFEGVDPKEWDDDDQSQGH